MSFCVFCGDELPCENGKQYCRNCECGIITLSSLGQSFSEATENLKNLTYSMENYGKLIEDSFLSEIIQAKFDGNRRKIRRAKRRYKIFKKNLKKMQPTNDSPSF